MREAKEMYENILVIEPENTKALEFMKNCSHSTSDIDIEK